MYRLCIMMAMQPYFGHYIFFEHDVPAIYFIYIWFGSYLCFKWSEFNSMFMYMHACINA